MSITLRYSEYSPFARKVRVFAAEAGLARQIDLDRCDVWAPDSDITQDNPLGKVPVLLTPDGNFVGSFLCCEYLDSLHGGKPLIPGTGPDRWRPLQLNALADGIMEAAVAHLTERLHRPAQFVCPEWLDRQDRKIINTLDVIERQYGAPRGDIDVAVITLGCALSYLDIRMPHLEWRKNRERLTAWHAIFSARQSMQATEPTSSAHTEQ